MFGKKGVSAVVAVVMIILVTVTAVTILWVAVIPMVQERVVSSEELGTNVRISTQDGYTTWHKYGQICLQVKRGSDDADISKILARIEVSGESFEEEFSEVPRVNSAVKECFMNEKYVSEPDSVSIFPVFNLNGNARKGSVTSEISGNKLPKASKFVCDDEDDLLNCAGLFYGDEGWDLEDNGVYIEEGLINFDLPSEAHYFINSDSGEYRVNLEGNDWDSGVVLRVYFSYYDGSEYLNLGEEIRFNEGESTEKEITLSRDFNRVTLMPYEYDGGVSHMTADNFRLYKLS